MQYLHLIDGKDGISTFSDADIDMSWQSFAPPAPELLISDPMAAKACLFLTLPVGWGGPQHRSPKRQMAMCLQGQMLVEAGDGQKRTISAGGLWLMADTNGSGHTTTVIGDQDVKLAIVQLE